MNKLQSELHRLYMPQAPAGQHTDPDEGSLIDATSFRADTVLAKHDENYMPKEVADALKKQGHWKDDYGKKPGETKKP